MQSREGTRKFTLQNGFNGAAAIFENVIVNDDEARLWRSKDCFRPVAGRQGRIPPGSNDSHNKRTNPFHKKVTAAILNCCRNFSLLGIVLFDALAYSMSEKVL